MTTAMTTTTTMNDDTITGPMQRGDILVKYAFGKDLFGVVERTDSRAFFVLWGDGTRQRYAHGPYGLIERSARLTPRGYDELVLGALSTKIGMQFAVSSSDTAQ